MTLPQEFLDLLYKGRHTKLMDYEAEQIIALSMLLGPIPGTVISFDIWQEFDTTQDRICVFIAPSSGIYLRAFPIEQESIVVDYARFLDTAEEWNAPQKEG